MVLDIRRLRHDGEPDEEPVELSAPAPSAGPAPGPDLEALLSAAIDGPPGRRIEALADLRSLVPTDAGVERLCRMVDDPAEPRRLVAIQVLGFHRQWLFQRSGAERVLAWIHRETDPAATAALVWILRRREAVQQFLLHPVAAAAREAAVGVPVSPATIDALVDALLVGRSHEVDRVLRQKLSGLHPSLTGRAVEHLLGAAELVAGDDLRDVLASLPQPPLFDLFVEGRSQPPFHPEPTPQDTARARRWRQVARLASQLLKSKPQAELIRFLVHRSASDETFARRHAEFLQAAMRNTRQVIGTDVLDDLERLTDGASEGRLERMARLLVALGDKIAGGQSHAQVADLLERWKSRSPALKLKIYQLQTGGLPPARPRAG